ncbi:MAG: flagellar hook-basal body complex protein [Oscillospiraceae bacterium]|nr:flagellar hook-basal body complex protein [Oscillospiraceae bacterium]
MTGSMYAAISGLKAHMGALNVIGNNVANVNTLAYKTTRYTFNEALYTTQINGTDGTEVSGGRNPAQIGFGANVGTIDLDMSTKNYTPTGLQLDTMIDGDGFFFVGDKVTDQGLSGLSVNDKAGLSGMKLSRLGNFSIDPNGYLVDGNGSVVWGFLEIDASASDIAAVNRMNGFEVAEDGTVTEVDDLEDADIKAGREALARLSNLHYKDIQVGTDDAPRTVSVLTSATSASNILTAIRLPQIDDEKNLYFPVPATSLGRLPTEEGDAVTQLVDRSELQTDGEDQPPAGDGETPTAINYSRVMGDTYSIDPKSGALTMLVNDELVTVGNLAIAKVTNPNGVTHVDGRYFQAMKGAGELRVTTLKSIEGVDSAGDTRFITGGLESSGTDLATEITNMITVQRGYQANTRIITVTDSMLEELVNMKR